MAKRVIRPDELGNKILIEEVSKYDLVVGKNDLDMWYKLHKWDHEWVWISLDSPRSFFASYSNFDEALGSGLEMYVLSDITEIYDLEEEAKFDSSRGRAYSVDLDYE